MLKKISINNPKYKEDYINIHTIDSSYGYEPDYDFTFKNIFDSLKKLEKFKKRLSEFKNSKEILLENFVQKLIPCESIELFKIFHEILEENGMLLITVPDFYAYAEKILKTKKNHYKKIYNIESKLFSISDSTGIYYNKTIWTCERLERCLNKSGFKKVKRNSKNRSRYFLSLIAIK